MLYGFLMELDVSDRIQRLMYIKRSYETETCLALIPHLKSAECFIDIGANVGYFSLLACAVNSKARVLSVEPLPHNIEKLQKNRELNHFSKMEILDVCISDHEGTTEFVIPPGDECGWGRIAYKEMFDGHRIQRTVDTVDRIVARLKIQKVNVIKIDVEGFEFKALLGMEQTLLAHKPVICIELNEPCLQDLNTSGNEIFQWLIARDYSLYSLTRTGSLQPCKEILPNYEYLNYFAIATAESR